MKYHTNIHNVICDSIISGPTFYLFSDFASSKIRVLDLIFNTVGGGFWWASDNGYMVSSSHKKYKPYRKERKRNIDHLYKEPHVCVESLHGNKYEVFLLTEEEFLSHKRYDEFIKGQYKLNNKDLTDKEKKILFLEQLENPPRFLIIHNIAENNRNEQLRNRSVIKYDGFTPYPNFTKQFSCIWASKAKYIKPDWKEEAIWYYDECLEFFNDPNRVKYYDHYPTEEIKLNLIDHIENLYPHMDKDSLIQEVNKDYMTKCFNGDNFDELLMENWNIKFNSIIQFINDTLDRLRNF